MLNRVRRAAFLLALPFLAGCIAMGGGRLIEFDEEARYEVKFENSEAARVFYEGLDLSDRDDYTEEGGFVVLLLVGGGESVFFETEHYNAQVRRADADRDGTISEEEASAYLDALS